MKSLEQAAYDVLVESANLDEASVSYKTLPNARYWVSGAETFEQLKKHSDIVKRMGPHTSIFDVTDEDRVKKAPGENKWNAMKALYGYDEDEIVCAKSFKDSWVCMSINVKV